MSYILSVPSYVIPGTWNQNVAYLASRDDIQAIELLLFLWNAEIEKDFLIEADALKQYTERFIFTVHLPEAPLSILKTIIALTHAFTASYTLHPPKLSTDCNELARALFEFEQIYQRPIILENTTLESLEHMLACIDSISSATSRPLCMDTAHLLEEEIEPIQFIEKYGSQIKTIHLNDYCQNKSHAPISEKSEWLIPCMHFLKDFNGILEFELFDIDAIDASLRYFNEIMKG